MYWGNGAEYPCSIGSICIKLFIASVVSYTTITLADPMPSYEHQHNPFFLYYDHYKSEELDI